MSQGPITFSFGKNWLDFVRQLPPDAVDRASTAIDGWFGPEGIRGKTVLDIGSGSGLHSLVFLRRGALRLASIDTDPSSVEATRFLWGREGRPPQWWVRRASLLDVPTLMELGTFDVVYCWGVAHHTGALWTALQNCCDRVAAGGLLLVAIYAKGPRYPNDLAGKVAFNRASALHKKWIIAQHVFAIMRERRRQGSNPFAWNKGRGRGMDTYHDLVDWLGGLPYEVATPEEVDGFCRERGFRAVRVEPLPEGGCSVYLYRRTGAL